VTNIFQQTQFIGKTEKNRARTLSVLLDSLDKLQDSVVECIPKPLSPERHKEIEKLILTGAITAKQCA